MIVKCVTYLDIDTPMNYIEIPSCYGFYFIVHFAVSRKKFPFTQSHILTWQQFLYFSRADSTIFKYLKCLRLYRNYFIVSFFFSFCVFFLYREISK